MRRGTKRNIENIIQTMLEAHGHVAALLQDKRIMEANDLLAQCQECAAHIGDIIEKSEGMDTQAVLYLEKYCEQLYVMSKTINKKKIGQLKNKLDNSLYHVEFELKDEILNDKIKIVFMPYKAAMWDCMESIWETAQEDDECEAYVVPIPYYERSKNGNIEKICYEGDVFPDYVPIVDFKNISLEVLHPDIIYIHNPYDGANYVTSVHPDYYSPNLKAICEKLVYIPYYILGEGPMDEMHKNLPAYQYMDKIIVQDEEKAESLLDYIPKEKIAVIGSPKVDRLLKLNKRKKEILKNNIPQKWKEKIQGKKVILFNISISGILQNSRYALEKIIYVLSWFKTREDVILLWRPHPLLETTLKSMRPEMYEKYISVKEEYIKENKGIFDETSDVGISAIIADAYIGEGSSSLVHYFGILGKPILYIDWKLLIDKKKDRDFLHFNSFFVENNSIFFVPMNNGVAHDLYKLNFENGIIEKVMTFHGEVENIWQCYCGIKKIKNRIILVPCNTKDIYIYDLNTNQANKIVLSCSKKCEMMFHGAVEYKGKLFLIPRGYPALVSVNIQDMKVCEYSDCMKKFLLADRNKILFSWAYYREDNYLYLASANTSEILIFNMENGNYKISKIGNFSYGYGHIVYDGVYFWLAAYRKNCVVRWNPESGDTREYIYPLDKEHPTDEIWSLLINYKNEIVICPGYSVEMIFINKNSGECRKHKVLENAEDIGGWEGFSYAGVLDNDKVVMILNKNSSVYVWNMCTGEWKSYLCRFSGDAMLEMEKQMIKNCWISKSTPYSLSESNIGITQFIDFVVTENEDLFSHSYRCYQGQKRGHTIGAEIHEYIKSVKL